MTVEQLDKARVLISLKAEDMDTYAISIDKLNLNNKSTKEALTRLMKLALDKVGISTGNKAVLVEAMPHREGLLILVTVDLMRKLRRVYHIKKPYMMPCCRFENAEGLLSCVERIKTEEIKLPKNSLWQYREKFYLLFDFTGISPRAGAALSEYARCFSVSLTGIARIKELGRELLKSNAVEIIADTMGKPLG